MVGYPVSTEEALLLDQALARREKEGRPICVGVVGAGSLSRMLAAHLARPVPGIRLSCIASRSLEKAYTLLDLGPAAPLSAVDAAEIDEALSQGRTAATNSAFELCRAESIDVVVDLTGAIEFGARVALAAIDNGKHLVMANAELDSTLGPILKVRADRAGVVVTNSDGDEPGVAMNLIRYLRAIGLRPVAAGNIKGMLDRYRTPYTQAGFAKEHDQSPKMVTSFADGSKLSMEAAVLANATGFGVGRRGMYGPRCDHVKEVAHRLPTEALLARGIVDYVLGAVPHTGAWVIVHEEDPVRMQHLDFLKMGPGPFYVFYTPFHLPHVQIVSTIARAVLWNEATIVPLGAPKAEVVTVAKRNLRAGQTLDGPGGFFSYGVIEDPTVARSEDLLPMGLSEGLILSRDVSVDEPITNNHVETRSDRLCDRLSREQTEHFH